MKYGVGYVGSKNTIAADIINALPSGNRLIDLFGGGGAITHCATLSNKYNTVVYNDYDLPVVEAIANAICGDGYWLKPDARSFYTKSIWESMSEEQHKEITHKFNKLIKTVNDNYIYYRPPRGRSISFMTTLMFPWHLELEKLLLNKMTNLDDIRLFFKRFWNGQWWWYSSVSHIKPITFTEFLNNRSLSRYIHKKQERK